MGLPGKTSDPEYCKKLQEYWNDKERFFSKQAVANALGVSCNSIDRHVRELRHKGVPLISRAYGAPEIPMVAKAHNDLKKTVREGIDPVRDSEKISGDFIFVISDVHIPYHSVYWLTRLLELAQKRREENARAKIVLAINGDLLDLQMLSRFGSGKDAILMQSIDECAQVLDAIGPFFDEISWNPGNHEDRFAQKMDRHLGFGSLAKLVKTKCQKLLWDQIKVIHHNFTILNDSWQCIHAKRYSKIPTRTAVQLADRWEINTIMGHEHHPPGFARTPNGKYFGVMGGHITDARKQAYIQTNRDLWPQWENGFVELYKCPDGETRFNLYSEKLTDWGEVLYGKTTTSK